MYRASFIIFYYTPDQQDSNINKGIVLVYAATKKKHTDCTRDFNTENILFHFIVKMTISLHIHCHSRP